MNMRTSPYKLILAAMLLLLSPLAPGERNIPLHQQLQQADSLDSATTVVFNLFDSKYAESPIATQTFFPDEWQYTATGIAGEITVAFTHLDFADNYDEIWMEMEVAGRVSGERTRVSALVTSGVTIASGNVLNMDGNAIINVADPGANQDAATRAYVDNAVAVIPTGDITAVNAGSGLGGGGTSGDVSLSLALPLNLSGNHTAGIIRASHVSNNNSGRMGSAWEGVFGESLNSNGVVGFSNGGNGVVGKNTSNNNFGTLGTLVYGVYGSSNLVGVYAENIGNGTTGYLAGLGAAVGGFSNSPSYFAGYFDGKVDVIGNLRVDGWATVDVLQIVGGSDLSEAFKISSENTQLLPGMIVSIDPEHAGALTISTTAYDRQVAGIISGAGGVQPGMLMGQQGTLASGKTPVALTGRVYAWTTAADTPVRPGDLLTTSNLPGHAMKVTDYARSQGAILGKAMSGLKAGERGLVLVLVSLQ